MRLSRPFYLGYVLVQFTCGPGSNRYISDDGYRQSEVIFFCFFSVKYHIFHFLSLVSKIHHKHTIQMSHHVLTYFFHCEMICSINLLALKCLHELVKRVDKAAQSKRKSA